MKFDKWAYAAVLVFFAAALTFTAIILIPEGKSSKDIDIKSQFEDFDEGEIIRIERRIPPPETFEMPCFLLIPKINLEVEVRAGSSSEEIVYETLAKGPIHIYETAFPGQAGNCVISGHRTTFTRPFNRIDELESGDALFLENPRGKYEYSVYGSFLINPAEDVTQQTIDKKLTLTTCHPEGSATHRLVVRADFVAFYPSSQNDIGQSQEND